MISHIRKFMNYFSKKSTNGPFQKKNRAVEDIFFLKSPWNFKVFYLIPENSRRNKASPLETPQNSVTPLRNFKV